MITRISTIVLLALFVTLLAGCEDGGPIGDQQTLPIAAMPMPTPTLLLDTYGPLPQPSGPIIHEYFVYSEVAMGLQFAGIDPATAQLSCSGPSEVRWTRCSILLPSGRQMSAYIRAGMFVME